MLGATLTALASLAWLALLGPSRAQEPPGPDFIIPPLPADVELRCFTTGLFESRCCLVWSRESRHGVLVDAGDLEGRVEDYARRNQIVVNDIVLTHAHFDHVMGLRRIKAALEENNAKLGASRQVTVFASKDEAATWRDAQKIASVLNVTLGEDFPAGPDRELVAGQAFAITPQHYLLYRKTPGHSPGHVMYYCPTMRVAFTGDVMTSYAPGRDDLPNGSFGDQRDSVYLLRNEFADYVLYPGHGGPFMIEHVRGIITSYYTGAF